MYHGIACIFQELWYNPSHTNDGRTSLPSGKLYDQYTNICKELRKFGLRESRRGVKRPGEDIACDGSEDLARLLPCALSNEDVEERLQFLQTELNDWETINRYWQETVRHRQAKLRSDAAYEATYEYVNTYPVLKQPEGYKLLQSDFRQLFPQAYGRIASHWEPFAEKVKEQLSIENISIPARCSDAELLHLFARLVTTVPLKVPKGKAWKPSRKDILDGFLCYAKTDDLIKHCDGLEERYRARGLTVQPFPMIIGESLANIHTHYFVIDKTPITLPTTRDLFAATFYAYHSLYCRYPLQSARLWVIVEKALFGMEEVKDPQSQAISKIPEVKRLISVLRV
ncbi:uncharacterized protein LOC124164466 [Ischnura elegans]|uniref:uncharacterized protein LOC124164466 n=1 Tax=Ischnura elegans TaxID=197161 RepID=UPI001ED8B7B4|nr:uncharacterized protein LOC124164466 [Ischnura elegans]